MRPLLATPPVPAFLSQRPALWELPLAPALPVPEGRQAAEEQLVAATWNRLGGLLGTLSTDLGFDPSLALAVLCAESGGRAFATDGKLMIRFEAHVFWRLWGSKQAENARVFERHYRFDPRHKWLGHEFRLLEGQEWIAVHRNQATEWEALGLARRLDDTAALCSASMGAPQLMGFHHQRIGYACVQDMLAAFSHPARGERAQILGLFDFLRGPKGNSALLQALAQNDLLAFARLYNGPGQADAYAERIKRCEGIFAALEHRALNA